MKLFIRAFLHEAGAEILKAFRAPEYLVPTVTLPVGFYTLFAIVLPGSRQYAPYMLATYGVFAVIAPGLFGFGAGVASERERGWLTIKRAAPAPALCYIGAKLVVTLVFAGMALALIYAAAGFGAGVALPRATWLTLLGVHLLSALPFVFAGLTLGFLLSSGGAVAAANILFLSFSALGGLWMPVMLFPPILKKIAGYLPSYHLGEVALAVIGAPGERAPEHNLVMAAAITAVFIGLAVLAWVRQR